MNSTSEIQPAPEASKLVTAWTSQDSSTTNKLLNSLLQPCLPYCVPLYRRIQLYARTCKVTGQRQGILWLARSSTASGTIEHTSSLSTDPQSLDHLQQMIEANPADPWLIAHLDLSNAGQTQVWIFGSWELHYLGSKSLSMAAVISASPEYPKYAALFQALYSHLRREHIPHLSPTPPTEWLRLKSTGKIVSEPYSPTKVLFGTVSEALWPFIHNDTQQQAEVPQLSRKDWPYLKFIMKHHHPSTDATYTLTVPADFHLAPLQTVHLQLMIDRTVIPRTIETISQLVNVGLFHTPTNTPVAWGLLGKDASLSSLHTEASYRGRGFAEIVAKGLMVRQAQVFGNDGDGADQRAWDYVHTDVSESNMASRRVMEKLGGEVMWKVGWIEVDLAGFAN